MLLIISVYKQGINIEQNYYGYIAIIETIYVQYLTVFTTLSFVCFFIFKIIAVYYVF